MPTSSTRINAISPATRGTGSSTCRALPACLGVTATARIVAVSVRAIDLIAGSVLIESPEEKGAAGPEHAGHLAETGPQRVVIQVLEDMRREDDVKRLVIEGQPRGGRHLQPDSIAQTGPGDLALADSDQVRRDVDAEQRMGEGNPLRQGDQDVADAAAEVKDAILRRDAGRAQDAPVGGVDHPESASGKHVTHHHAAQPVAEPLTVGLADGGLVHVSGITAHWP